MFFGLMFRIISKYTTTKPGKTFLYKKSLRSPQTSGLVPANSPLKRLHERTGHRDLSHEAL